MADTTYAKLREDGSLDILTRVPGVANATPQTIRRYALANGYKVVVYTTAPGEWYSPVFKPAGSSIQEEWEPWGVEQKIMEIQSRLQMVMDSKAAERGYDNIFTALTYIDSKNPKFKAEALALKDWRDEMWTEGYDYIDKIEKGEFEVPNTWEDVEKLLPKFEWPVL